jgi:hypothetical protein
MKRNSAKKMDMNSLLKSRNMLYVVLFFAMANLFSYLMLKQLDAVAFFIIIGFLTTYFSKNMIVVMLTAMISTFLLVQIKMLGNTQEGLEMKGDEKTDKMKDSDSEKKPAQASAAPPDPVSTSEGTVDRAKAVVPATAEKEKFTQKLSPARFNANDDDDTPRSHKPKVDYAATLESAYDNLDKLLSSDAIRNMAADTGRLAEKQQMLMGNIEKMGPIMEKAGNLLGSFDMGSINKLVGNVNDGLKRMDKNLINK